VENLPDVLAAIPRAHIPNALVIVVDDGSTDDTAGVAYRSGADIVVSHEHNRGLGAALRTGIATALQHDAAAAVYIDADGEYDPADIPAMLRPVLHGSADYVLGSRYRGRLRGQRLSRLVGNKILNVVVTVLSGHVISDGQTGLRAFSRRALESAEIIHDYNYAQVLTLDLLKKGMRLEQVPITYQTRKHGRSFVGPQYLWRVPVGILREVLTS
jgi:glycosyltransferase involved in cell wall biosynthesis